MFWKKWRRAAETRAVEAAGHGDASRWYDVDVAFGAVRLSVPEGTFVDAFSACEGSLCPPGAAGELIYSTSSYDIELHDLQDVRAATAALGEGERLVDPPSGPPADDFNGVHIVEATGGPYAECGGYLMRLQLLKGQYLRALRIAATDPDDAEWRARLVARGCFAPDLTRADLAQKHPDAFLVVPGSYFSFAPPPHWKVYLPNDDEDVEFEESGTDDATKKFYCLAPDERAIAEIKVADGFSTTPVAPKKVEAILDEHVALELRLMEEQGGGVVLDRAPGHSLTATRDLAPGPDGRFERLYAAESINPDHRVYVHYWISMLVEDADAAEWARVVEAIEPCIRNALIYHPRSFVAGENG